ncbi:Protein of unknown function DUF1722 [Desulfarculus baarsii DSM 2075]|uniref:DUF1722 domain-containing protein n=1 Tax=Desulfarculus baarsii (strain ATCC 33931 / DSM 2075 / LMG 7858 / VKM B-1802 / 2st14) TaxID=644282 RepID=E1QL76_DESB2|nr:DUF523 and DUF1722 domain-containing protein [Desulfarculus baarsii]ADK85341.1 Protein of unknown function DUF1722 [Desulfarculus baarsii DSM 2075]
MRQFARPKVALSQCLGSTACRWNGAAIDDPFVRRLAAHVDFLPVCPEMAIGLGAPRAPLRVVDDGSGPRLLQPATGLDHTRAMVEFCQNHLAGLTAVDGFLLKDRSPSCGPHGVRIYAGPQKGASSRQGGDFFGLMAQQTHPRAAIETEGRLRNFTLREHFLTKLFTLAAFGQVAASERLSALVEFQAANKLLLMAYNQQAMRALGRVVAAGRDADWPTLTAQYANVLQQALARQASRANHQNALQHAMGWFKKDLTGPEKAHFLDLLAKYRAGKAPLAVLQALVAGWAIRHQNSYLAGQSYLRPYPEDLLDLGDSGKGRDF